MLDPFFKGAAKTQDGMVLGSGPAQHAGLCWERRRAPTAPPAVGLLFPSLTEYYKELWTLGLNTRLVPSTFHQFAAASSQAAYESHVQVAAGESGSRLKVSCLNLTPPWLAGHLRPTD